MLDNANLSYLFRYLKVRNLRAVSYAESQYVAVQGENGVRDSTRSERGMEF